MKRLLLLAFCGIVLIFLLSGILIGISISTMERNYSTLETINRTLLERTTCMSSVDSLIGQLTAGLKNKDRGNLAEETTGLIKQCKGCHDRGPVTAEIKRLETELRNVQKSLASVRAPVRDPVNAGITGPLYSSLFRIRGFAEGSLLEMNRLLKGYFSSIENTAQTARWIFIFSLFTGAFSTAALGLFVFRRVSSIERDNEEKNRVIQDWASQWQQLFDSMADMIAIVDERCTIVNANQAFHRAFGDNITGRDICGMLRIPCMMKDRAGHPLPEISRIIHADNRVFSFRTYPMMDRAGRHIIVLRDITKEYELERRTMQAEQLASLGQLTACIAHEIRNPLTGIVGYAEILTSQPLDSPASGYVKKIYNSAKRINAVVEDMLFYAKSSRLRKSDVNINEIIDEVADELSDSLSRGDVKLVRNYSSLPRLCLDRELIKIVINNIIRNAVHAITTSGTGDCISVSTFRDRDSVKITIKDNGPGIKKDNLGRVFDPFFTTGTKSTGTGLGMWMTYNFVRAHQGDIRVNSKPEEGTVFDITFPIEQMVGLKEYTERCKL